MIPFGRVKKMLLAPRSEWEVIAEEEPRPVSILIRYILPLAALPALSRLLGSLLWALVESNGASAVSSVHDYSFEKGIIGAAIEYSIGVGLVYAAAFVLFLFAGHFTSEKSFGRALQLVTYSFTASWAGGALLIIPAFGMLIWLVSSVYGLVIMAMGFVPVLKTPGEKVAMYMILVIAITSVAAGILATILGFFFVVLFTGIGAMWGS